MTVYRRDPDTGAVFADGGIYGIRTIDDRRAEDEDWAKMMERRANITRPRLTFSQRLALTRHEDDSIEEITRRRLREFPARTRARSAVATRFHSPAPRPRRGSDRPGWLQAVESYDYINCAGRRVHVKVGGYADPKSEAVIARPLAWAA
jgi:hypothetical protein